MYRDVYSGWLKLEGREHQRTLLAANNYTNILSSMKRLEEARSLLRKTIPVARRVLGDSHDYTLTMRKAYAEALYKDPSATLDDLNEAVTRLEAVEPIARRVFGGAHPVAVEIGGSLRTARKVLRVCSDGGRVKFV